ncbi:MAG TPA: DNA primase DnaG [Methanomicrobiales archaeon]|nr:DNA primase DnaG [Methanomicrobiales archaeon]
MYSSDTTKYLIRINLHAEGVVEKSDVVGAIFGQTEGLLGEDLDLRDLQRTGRVGRIDVQIASKKGETRGDILIASSLDRAETAILAASLETIDRVGPCVAHVSVEKIEDIRVTKRKMIVDRAKELLIDRFDEGSIDSTVLLDDVRESLRIEKVSEIGPDHVPAGPNVLDSDAIIIVEGRADVIQLLRYGIKNAAAVEGTKVPATIVDLCQTKTATSFLDGDRGGELILRELLQVADIDYAAFAPRGRSVEDLSRKEVTKALRNKVPVEFVREQLAEKAPEGRLPKVPSPEPAASAPREREAPARKREGAPRGGYSLRDHVDEVSGQGLARFISSDFSVVAEVRAGDVERSLAAVKGDVTGIVADQVVDQRLLDQVAQKGIDFILAKDFRGIIKRPLPLKLLRFAQIP